jgi:uncharacterized protein YciU (UPF0263 family)
VTQSVSSAKKTAWHGFINSSALLSRLGKVAMDEDVLTEVELFVVKLYSPTSSETSINDLLAGMFRFREKNHNLFHIQRTH